MAVPVDARLRGTAPTFITCGRLVLDDIRRAAVNDQIGSLQQGGHTHGKQTLEVNSSKGVIGTDRRVALQYDGTLIEAVCWPEDSEPGDRVAVDNGPVDGTRPPIPWQQRRVVLDHAVTRNVDEILRYELQNERHHSEPNVELAEHFASVFALERRRLKDLDAGLLGGQPE